MSNCNCIEKVVAAINAVSDDYTFEAGTGLRTALNRIVAELTSPDRLAPTPATDWREKCRIGNQSDTDWWIRFTNDGGLFLWYHHTTGWVGAPYQLNQPCYPTESAARAALAAAPEPGKAVLPGEGVPGESDGADRCDKCGEPLLMSQSMVGHQGKSYHKGCYLTLNAEPPSPAPAVAFDPEKMMWKGQAEAWESVVKCCEGLGLDMGDGSGSGEQMVLRFIRGLAEPKWCTLSDQARAEHLLRYCPFFRGIEETRNEIAAALRAAEQSGYERGTAEAAAQLEVIDGERKALAKMVSAVVDATRPVHEQLGASPEPSAAKEGT